MKILVVEDDRFLADSISLNLTRDGFIVDKSYSGKDGSYLARTSHYDLVILDYYLGDTLGLDVTREIRAKDKATKILVLSGEIDSTIKAKILDAGADDYINKPFSYIELVARINALNRRSNHMEDDFYNIHDLFIDTKRNIVKRGGKNVVLTNKEFNLLELLVKANGIIVNRSEIMETVWKKEADPFSNTIESHIVNLRRKINLDNKKRNLIISCHGKGYRIDINQYGNNTTQNS